MNKRVAFPMQPTPERLAHPAQRYLSATRPACLTITLVGCLLGFATAWPAGAGCDGMAAAKRPRVARLVPERAAHGYGFQLLPAATWRLGVVTAMLPALTAATEPRAPGGYRT